MSSSPRRQHRRKLSKPATKSSVLKGALRFKLQISKERAIGVHPKYLHSYVRQRLHYSVKEWERASRNYDRNHGG